MTQIDTPRRETHSALGPACGRWRSSALKNGLGKAWICESAVFLIILGGKHGPLILWPRLMLLGEKTTTHSVPRARDDLFTIPHYCSESRSPDIKNGSSKWMNRQLFDDLTWKTWISDFMTWIDVPRQEKHSTLGPSNERWLLSSRHCCPKSRITWHLRQDRATIRDLRHGFLMGVHRASPLWRTWTDPSHEQH